MEKNKITLAIDIGASGGRHIVSSYQEGQQVLDEVYRFDNYMNHTSDGLCWDLDRLWREIKQGIITTCRKYPNLQSIGIDTWGVDYVLLNQDTVIEPAYAYRNDRTKASIPLVHEKVPFERLYQITGSQYQTFNTIYQLYDDKCKHRFDAASDFLMLPEYFFYKLTGKKVKEYTNATTTGLVDISKGEFSQEIINGLGFDQRFFPPLTKPGFTAPLKSELQKEFNTQAQAVLIATHDTASAVEGVKVDPSELYISSGTWSLLGVKVENPILTKQTLDLNFSHEGGVNYIRFQKNIMGLWIVQNLKKEFEYESYEEMIQEAMTSTYQEIFDVNDERFLAPASMRGAILDYMKEHHRALPIKKGDFIQSFYVSLATSYKKTMEEIEAVTKKRYTNVTIFGGGAKNTYLNQIIKNITMKNIAAYPIEATALGNIKIQEESL